MISASWPARFRVPLTTMPQWAADQPDHLVYAANHSGLWQIYAWDMTDGSHRQVTDHPGGARIARLTPDGETICWFADNGGTERGRWLMQPFTGDQDRPLATDIPPSWRTGLALGPGNLVAAGFAATGGWQVRIGRAGGPSAALLRSDQPASPAAFSRDGKLLAVSCAGPGGATRPAARIYDAESRTAVAQLSDGTGGGIIGLCFSPVPGDSRIAFLHERAALVRPGVWDPETGDRTDLPLNLPGDIEIVDWLPAGDGLILVHSHRGTDDVHILDLDDGSIRQLPHPPGTITDAAVRDDRAVWLRRAAGDQPPRIELASTGQPVMQPPEVAGCAPYEPWQFSTPSGHTVYGFLARPPGRPPHPTIILVHGGPYQHDANTWNPTVQALVDNGWAVAMLNYRGSTGRGRQWLDLGRAHPSLPQVEDIVAGRDDLIRSSFSAASRIVLAGGSWGGYLTLLTIGVVPAGWSAAIAIVPLADLVAAYHQQAPGVRHMLDALFGGSPDEQAELYRVMSPMTYARHVRTPVLIVAGENDTRCPLPQIANYLAELGGRGRAGELRTYPCGHNSLAADEQILQMEAMLRFLDEQAPIRRLTAVPE